MSAHLPYNLKWNLLKIAILSMLLLCVVGLSKTFAGPGAFGPVAMPGPLLKSDTVPWQFDAVPPRIVVVGDIHGDLAVLHHILNGQKLVNSAGHWVGGKAHLVLLGDFNGRGHDSRFIFEYLMRLEGEAQQAQGFVHSIIGNHDLFPLVGIFENYTREEARMYRGFRAENGIKAMPFAIGAFETLRNQVNQGNSEYQDNEVLNDQLDFWAALSFRYRAWFLRRNAFVQIGPYLFSHAGWAPWMIGRPESPAQVNATIRSWVSLLTRPARVAVPPPSTAWVMVPSSDLWDRRLARGFIAESSVSGILKTFHAETIFIGHEVVPLAHSIYGDRVYLMDSGNSHFYEGRGTQPSSAVIQNGQVSLWDHERPEHISGEIMARNLGLEDALPSAHVDACKGALGD